MGIRVSFGKKFTLFYPFEETNEIDLTYNVYPNLSSIFEKLGLNKICGIIGGGEQIASLSYRHAKEVLGIDINLIQAALFYLKLFPERSGKIDDIFFNSQILSLVPFEDLKRFSDISEDDDVYSSLKDAFKWLGKRSVKRLEYRGSWKDYLQDLGQRVCSNECNLEILVSDLFDVESERIGEYDVLYLSSMCEVKETRGKKARNWCRRIMKYVKRGDLVLIEASLYPTTRPIFKDFGKFKYALFSFPEDYRGMSECAYVAGNEDVLNAIKNEEYEFVEGSLHINV